ncbi:hypothetical protein Q7P37_000411 [Cladosporium fusiforme]
MAANTTHIGPDRPLPHSDDFANSDEYVDALLAFAGSNELLQTLCGGVHILDFFTSTPDLYSRILPQEWRDFFVKHEIMDILDLLMREDLDSIDENWREGPSPPSSLLEYIRGVPRHVAVGMNVKKVHEVGIFSSYVHNLTSSISDATGHPISHLVDFGSGQNYLGRALASPPYDRNIVAIESRGHNQDRAIKYDIMAKLRQKEDGVMRNKKAFRAGLDTPESGNAKEACEDGECTTQKITAPAAPATSDSPEATVQLSAEGKGTIQYVEHWIEDGNLRNVIDQIVDPAEAKRQITHTAAPAQDQPGFQESHLPIPQTPQAKNAMIISLHSCGNLVHHGIRSLTLNPSVRAICLVGCCYNLLTERLTPATYKLPSLRPAAHPRVEQEAMRGDPHGFPMSARLCNDHSAKSAAEGTPGVKLNITARMMGVQAPQNWTEKDSAGFFLRHFYRALLQRVFLDKEIVPPPQAASTGSSSPLGHTSGTPIIIGSLRKACYASFPTYVRGALAKLYQCPVRGEVFREKMASVSDAELADYETGFAHRKHDLSVVWSLMAFSAGVVESLIVVDRFLWLREQAEVGEAWVEPVFDYAVSPRNMVVVGIKK